MDHPGVRPFCRSPAVGGLVFRSLQNSVSSRRCSCFACPFQRFKLRPKAAQVFFIALKIRQFSRQLDDPLSRCAFPCALIDFPQALDGVAKMTE